MITVEIKPEIKSEKPILIFYDELNSLKDIKSDHNTYFIKGRIGVGK